MSGQVSRGSVGDYQEDERAGVARLSWRVSGRSVREKRLDVITGARCKEIRRDAVLFEKDGRTETIPCDCVYYAVGMRSEDSLYTELAALGIRITAAGDCKKTGKVAGAVHSGYFAAMDIGKF